MLYWKNENGKLYCGDNVSILSQFEDENIDCVITSPPYDNLRTYGKDNLDDVWNFEKFKQLAKELYRVLKNGGVIVWVVNDATINGSETGTSFKQALYFKDECGFNLHDTMIYAKNNYLPLTHNRYEQQFEYMFVFSKGKPKTFNSIKIPTKNAGKVKSMSYVCGATFEKKSAMRSGTDRKIAVKKEKIKPNIWYYTIGSQHTTKDRIAFKHPAVFPEQLVHDHIISWTNENDVVLDPFMGSGTVAKMCEKLNRKWIGIEINLDYCEIIKRRLEKNE